MRKSLIDTHFTNIYDDVGGKYVSKVNPNREYHVIEWIDMEDACGRDNLGLPCYVVELSAVHLNEIPADEVQRALDSCSFTLEDVPELGELGLVDCIYSYGHRAPLWTGESKSITTEKNMHGGQPPIAKSLLDEAARYSLALRKDASAYAERMNRLVNAIGSSASEYMRGDINAALTRRLADSQPQQEVDRRPEDFLPYVMGYMTGKAGGAKETGDVAPEYLLGYERGVSVAKGESAPPTWIGGEGPRYRISRKSNIV